jgi:hypothetical protein
MEEVDIGLENLCADLLGVEKFEPILLQFLGYTQAGEWKSLVDVCQHFDIGEVDVNGVFVTWLQDPAGNEGYVVFLYYHPELLWSMTAHYNRERLLVKATSRRQPMEAGHS